MKNLVQHSFRRHISFIVLGIVILVTLPFMIRYISTFIPLHWPSESITELERIRAELPLAEALWKSHGMADYDIDVNVHGVFCYDPRGDIITPLHLKIRQSEMIFENDIQRSYIECYVMSDFLPPKVFETIKQRIETADPQESYLKIEFDPEYGFVSELLYEPNSRMLSGRLQYIFYNFRPKKP